MVNSNIGTNLAPLQDTRFLNLGDLEFDLPSSLQVKSNGVIGLPIYEFLLMYNSNHMSISHRSGDNALEKFFPLISYHRAKIMPPPPRPTPTPGRFFFQDQNTSSLGSREAPYVK